jgi:acyl carrier protein
MTRAIVEEDRQNVEKRIFALLVAALGGQKRKSKITPEQYLRKDLGIDSMALLSLALAFEEEFGIKLPHTELNKMSMQTVGQLVAYGTSLVVEAGESHKIRE